MSEPIRSTWYSFLPPTVKEAVKGARHYFSQGSHRIELRQSELVEPLRALGLVETETVVEVAALPDPAFAVRVDAFHATIPLDLAGSIIVGVRGFAFVETPSRLGEAEHRTRRARVERFLREQGITFTAECKIVLTSDACPPHLGLIAPERVRA